MTGPTCFYCKLPKALDEMFWRKDRSGVLKPSRLCISCNAERHRQFYYKFHEDRKAAMRARHHRKVARLGGRVRPRGATKWVEAREFFIWLKEGCACLDCGQHYHYSAMDFDHVRGAKKFNIAAVTGRALTGDELWDEIQKCELVCSNCHRVRTHSRKRAA